MSHRLGQIQSQHLSQIQKLILTPQMQQALRLLQLPVQELSTIVAEELEKNPLLEYTDEIPFREPSTFNKREQEDLKSFIENTTPYAISLFDHLINQARDTFSTKRELLEAEAIIGQLDSDGFLSSSLEEIGLLNDFPINELESLLEEIQTFDPKGVGARTLRESLLIQLRCQGKEGLLAFRIIDDHFNHLLHNRLPAIAKALGSSAEGVRETIEQEIALLDLHPGTNYSRGHYPQVSQSIVVDLTIQFTDSEPEIIVCNENLHSFRVNSNYQQMLQDKNLPKETREYIEEKIASGKWLMRNLVERHRTLYRIGQQIVEKQKSFLSDPKGQLAPLTMKEIAQTLELHESTVVRAVANKYLSCPRGIFLLRFFFTHGYLTKEGKNISSRSVKELLKEILTREDRHSPLSDEAISAMIKEHGIPCARRTVAKYRHELEIGNTSQRKRF